MGNKNNTYYLIGSWIPTLGEINFEDLSEKEELNNVDKEDRELNIKFVFTQISESEIEKIEIRYLKSESICAIITDIQVQQDGFWHGKMELKINKEWAHKKDFLDATLNSVNTELINYYHKHVFHKDKSNIEISLKEIRYDEYNNKQYSDITFKKDVVIKIMKQYRRKLSTYQNVITYASEKDRAIDKLIQKAKGELLFFKSFLELFKADIHEDKIIKTHEYNEIVNQYLNIFIDKINIGKTEIINLKANRLAFLSVIIGILSIVVSLLVA